MSNVYLHYEAVATFGVIASPSVPSVLLPAKKYPSPLVVTAGVDAVQVWSLRKGDVVARFSNADIRKSTHISCLAVSEDGGTIAAGYHDGSVRIWRVELGVGVESLPELQPTATYNGHRAHITAVIFADSSRLVTGSADGDLILWDLAGESGIFRLPAHTDAVTALVFQQRAGRDIIISASKDSFLRVYDVGTQHCVQTVAGHRAEVWAMATDPSKTLLVTGSVDENVRVFRFREDEDVEADAESRDVLEPLGTVVRRNALNRVCAIHCGTSQGESFVLVANTDRNAELFRIRSVRDADKHRVRRRKRFEEKAQKRKEIGVDDDEPMFEDRVEAKDYLVSVRPLQMSAKFRGALILSDKYQIGVKNTSALEVRFLIHRADNALEIHKVIASKKVKKRKRVEDDEEGDEEVGAVEKVVALDRSGHRSDVRAIALSSDDRTMLSAGRKSLKLWNIAEGKCIRSMQSAGYALCTSFLAVDASFAAVGSKEGTLEVFEVGTGACVSKIPDAHSGAVWSMALDNHIYEADVLITGGADKTIRFWNIQDLVDGKQDIPKPKRTLSMPDEVLCLRVAQRNNRPLLFAALMDSTVRAHFLDTLEPAMHFYGHTLPIMAMDVSSDGQILATGSADKTVKLWDIDFGNMRRSLRAHEDAVVSIVFQPGTHYMFSGSRDGTLKYWDADKFEFITELAGPRGEVWDIAASSDGELLAAASHDRTCRIWRRTDNPLFLLEEQDKRMDDLMDRQLIEDDVREARKERGKKIDFVDDDGKGEALRAGKLTLDAVKGGERLLRGLELYEEDEMREKDDAPNPELLGMNPLMYILRVLEQIRTADLDEVCHVLPLKQAMALLGHINKLLDKKNRMTRLSSEILVRVAMQLVRIHQNQVIAGACDRVLISTLLERINAAMEELRLRYGVNGAALGFWVAQLADEDNAAFRDAHARAHNAGRKRKKRAGVAVK